MSNVDFKVAVLGKTFIMEALKDALDTDTPLALELVSTLKKKMNPTPDVLLAEAQADARVQQLTKDLDECLSGTRSKFIDRLAEMGIASETYVDDKVEDEVHDKMGEYLDEDQVKDLINGAWNGA